MDSLRLTLLTIGVLFVAILYLVMRIKSGKPFSWPSLSWPEKLRLLPGRGLRTTPHENKTEDFESARDSYFDEPDEEDIQALSQMTLQTGATELDVSDFTGISAVAEDDNYEGEPLILVLNVMAKPGQRFRGMDVLDALYANDMNHGEMMIFHRYPEGTTKQQPIFSLANTVEPGHFDLDTIEELQTPGLSMFMQLPGPIDSRDAFELMLRTGRNLAQQLDGDLCDERRSVLTMQTIGHIKEQIEAFLFRQKMSRLQKQRPTGKGRGTRAE